MGEETDHFLENLRYTLDFGGSHKGQVLAIISSNFYIVELAYLL